jgi:hypothetical protein
MAFLVRWMPAKSTHSTPIALDQNQKRSSLSSLPINLYGSYHGCRTVDTTTASVGDGSKTNCRGFPYIFCLLSPATVFFDLIYILRGT